MNTDILNVATEKINGLIEIKCRILNQEIRAIDKFIDAEIAIYYGSIEERYFAEIRKKIVPDNIPKILEQTKGVKNLMLLADYITPTARELLRMNNIQYVDTAGNMFLKNQNMYVLIQTNKTNRAKLNTNTKAFNKAGLKVIYQFLTNPEFLNKPYRFIGEKAKVTIATVGIVLKDLLRENYILQANTKEYKFQNREKLFEEWVKEYNRNLRPKLKKKRYRWLNKNENWRTIKLPIETYWGGANAAEKLTEYLIADKIEIYTALQFEEVMKVLKIIPDNKGEITVTEIFWKDQHHKSEIIDPMLIYADLLNETNPRYLETANKIYKAHVQDKL